jgi:hypothetical protein
MDEIREGSIMSEEQINIAIAEACGWTIDERIPLKAKESATGGWIPDFCNDLNAMHEAEKMLDFNQLRDMEDSVSFRFAVLPFHATAAQRAEAFLRTLGKWEEK